MISNYNLVIDKDRADVLGYMFTLAMQTPNFVPQLTEEGLGDTLLELLAENADKTHERGWCEDPECKDNKNHGD